jgi:L-iditol 2-dehydrogenase
LKGIFRAGKISSPAVIGAGALGLMHGLCLRKPVLYELREDRRKIAQDLGFTALHPTEAVHRHETIFVCPGSQSAFDFAASIAAPDATIVLFAPLPDGEGLPLSYASGYFKDLQILHTYSCGPDDTAEAFRQIKSGVVTAEKVVSDFVSLDHLPEAYASMKAERILKAMVLF